MHSQHFRAVQRVSEPGIQHEPEVLSVHQHTANRSYGNSVESADAFDTTGGYRHAFRNCRTVR
jgi:hypothetical protein